MTAQTQTETIADFIKRLGITMNATRVNANPLTDDFGPAARHFLCVLQLDHQTFSTPFSQGSAHRADPTIEDILSCMASDCSAIENSNGFDEWASDLGYDTDSRKAENTYRACVDASIRLQDFLGDKAYNQLLWNTERL